MKIKFNKEIGLLSTYKRDVQFSNHIRLSWREILFVSRVKYSFDQELSIPLIKWIHVSILWPFNFEDHDKSKFLIIVVVNYLTMYIYFYMWYPSLYLRIIVILHWKIIFLIMITFLIKDYSIEQN